jgi:DNA-binding transcriptional LysR family regulator
MNLNHLRAFAAIADEGSITGAAKRMRVSQPALSKQLGEFESALGLALCIRGSRGIELTAAGAVLHRHAHRIFAAEGEAEAELAAMRDGDKERVTVGADASLATHLLPFVLVELYRDRPSIRAAVRVYGRSAAIDAVRSGEADVVVTDDARSTEGLVATEFARDQLVLVLPPEHPWRGRTRVETPALRGQRLVIMAGQPSLSSHLAKSGVASEVVAEFPSAGAVCRSAVAGLGVAVVSKLVVEPGMDVVALADSPVRTLWCIHRVEALPHAAALVAVLQQMYGRPAS